MRNQLLLSTPGKSKHINNPDSVEKLDRFGKSMQKEDKLKIPSFLDGFATLNDDDMSILADFEEE